MKRKELDSQMGGQGTNDNGAQGSCVEDERGTQPMHCRRQKLWCRDGQITCTCQCDQNRMTKPVYRVRVGLIEIREFLERYYQRAWELFQLPGFPPSDPLGSVRGPLTP